MNALANPAVGQYLNENFVASFQKVATFRITANGRKQAGNVAAYFCAPDGRVLHVVAGPVDAATMLREARWVVDTARRAMAECKGDGGAFKAYFRKAHAERLRRDFGIQVQPITFDLPDKQDENGALTYRDPSGRPIAPVLRPVPTDGPDVSLRPLPVEAAGRGGLVARKIRPTLSNQARVHMLLAAHCMKKIETLYGSIFEGILGEKITTRPVEVDTPFPWLATRANGRK